MITISHAQARRLISAHLDQRQLPDEQWAALHAHLESCAACRAARDRLEKAERRLRRGLRQRWDAIDGPFEATAEPLAALYHERWAIRRLGRRMLGGAAAFLACALLVVALSGMLGRGGQAAAAVDTAVPPTPLPSPTPTRVPADYPGVIAYEYRAPAASGASDAVASDAVAEEAVAEDAVAAAAEPAPGEIYLLNTGAEPSNLTNHPANDYAPAWSPDGEWLAFLSDRTGKDEVYVTHLSGSRLTQLTDLPGVAWRGPLSWSADGQMLALVGERTIGETSQTWVYLVPLDGSNAYPLGRSAGALMAAFAPRGALLAFSGADAWQGGLAIYDFDPGRESFTSVTVDDSSQGENGWNPPNRVDKLVWSTDGLRLLFRTQRTFATASGEAVRSGLRYVTIPQDGTQYDLYSQGLTRGSAGEGYASFSWTGVKNEYAALFSPTQGGCQTIRIGATVFHRTALPETHNFCVTGELARENWQVKDKSVLVTGRELDRPGQVGLYVVRYRGEVARAEWLADARGITSTPLLRPIGDRLEIAPRAVQPPEAVEAASPALPGPETGDLLMVTHMNERALIERVDPAGRRRTLLNQSIGVNSCPRWSPDRARIAFLSDRSSPADEMNQLFVMDSSGLNVAQVTTPDYIFVRYGCPLWSPYGRWLATASLNFIAVVPLAEKDGSERFIELAYGAPVLPVAWLPDGRLLVEEYAAAALRAYAPDEIGNGPRAQGSLLFEGEGDFVSTAVLAPDGKTLAMNLLTMNRGGESSYWLVTAALGASTPGGRADSISIQSRFPLPENVYAHTVGWLPDGRAGFLLNYPEGRREKAALFAWAGEGGQPEQIAALEDTLIAAAWSDDNRWLTVITETGRYVLDLSAEQPAPVWVGSETSGDIDW